MSARHANDRDSNCCDSIVSRSIRTCFVAKILTRAHAVFSRVDSAAFTPRMKGSSARVVSGPSRARVAHSANVRPAAVDRALDCACVSASDRRFNRRAAALISSLHLSELAA